MAGGKRLAGPVRPHRPVGGFGFYSAGNREPWQGFEQNSNVSGLRL